MFFEGDSERYLFEKNLFTHGAINNIAFQMIFSKIKLVPPQNISVYLL